MGLRNQLQNHPDGVSLMGWWPCCCGGSPTCPPCDCSSWQLAISGVTNNYGADYASQINGTHIFTMTPTGCLSPGYYCSTIVSYTVPNVLWYDTAVPTCNVITNPGGFNLSVWLTFTEISGVIDTLAQVYVYGHRGTTATAGSKMYEAYSFSANLSKTCSITNSTWINSLPFSTICTTYAVDFSSATVTLTVT